jgi:hypothetical protein
VRPLAALFFFAALPAGLSAAEADAPLPYEARGKHLGVVNCASSLCHGSITPWKDSNVLQTEYVTWSRVDKHASKAYSVLFEERSQRIARNLGLKEPAQASKLCLDCHTHNPPPARRGERFKLADGVGCEACHGPSENWIRSHVAPGATHKDNLERGLYPTSEPVAQARLCISCHFGNKDKIVTHRMMGAGHPRMSFELDTFTQTEPPHFLIDDDWQKRKRTWDGVRVWAIGQAIVAQELIDVLLDPKRSHDGFFPELVVFDCHACHHPMSNVRWTPRQGIGPGRIRFNDANLLMLRQIVRQVLPGEEKDYNDQVAALYKSVAGEGGDTVESARKLRAGLDRLVARLAVRAFDGNDLQGILSGLIGDGVAGEYSDYAGAEQATMAIGSVLNFLAKRGELAGVRSANAALNRLHAEVRNDETFRPERFRAALAELGKTVR